MVGDAENEIGWDCEWIVEFFMIFLYTFANKLPIPLIGSFCLNLVFDDSGYFVLYATMLGIKGKFILTEAERLLNNKLRKVYDWEKYWSKLRLTTKLLLATIWSRLHCRVERYTGEFYIHICP